MSERDELWDGLREHARKQHAQSRLFPPPPEIAEYYAKTFMERFDFMKQKYPDLYIEIDERGAKGE